MIFSDARNYSPPEQKSNAAVKAFDGQPARLTFGFLLTSVLR